MIGGEDQGADPRPPTAGRRAWWRSPLIVALAFLGLAALASLSRGGAMAPATAEARPPAPDFAAPSFAGGEIALAAFRGKPVVLNFWASWCPPCRAEARELERVWQAYRNRGIVFLGVNIQDPEPEARAFLHAFGVTYPSVRDVTNGIATAYAVGALPTTVFIDRDGRIAGRWVGTLTEQQLVARVEELLR